MPGVKLMIKREQLRPPHLLKINDIRKLLKDHRCVYIDVYTQNAYIHMQTHICIYVCIYAY